MSDAQNDGPAPDAGSSPSQPHVPLHTVTIPADVQMVTLLGPRDEMLRTMERQFPQVQVHVRGNEFHLAGPSAEVALIERLIDELLDVIDGGQPLNRDAVERSIQMLRAQTVERPADVLTMNIVSNRGRTIRPKTLNQKRYVEAIDENTVVFGIGPAGTGKTYLAMAKAVAALQAKQVNRIILTRPAVEAGERLGFLPGTLNDKIDPTCGRSTTRCTTWSTRSRSRSSWPPAPSRSRRWHTCAVEPLTMRSSSSTRRRTPPASR